LAIAAGCGYKPEKKLAKVNIAFQEWVGYGPFFLAQEKGFFKEEGIEMSFIDEQLDSARRDAFKAGMLDCEGGTIDLLVSKTAQGTPITAVMEIDRSFGSDGIAAAEDIKTLKDLIGRRVAFTRDDVSETLLSYLFYKEGLSMDKITIVARGPDKAAQAFLGDEADAVVTWEPSLSKALKRPGAHLLVSTKELPEIIIDTLNVKNDMIKNNPALVKGIMRAWFKALKHYKEDPAGSSALIAKYYKITPEQYRKDVEGLKWIDYKDQDSAADYRERIDLFNAIADIKFRNKRIAAKPDAKDALNITLLQGLYNENSK